MNTRDQRIADLKRARARIDEEIARLGGTLGDLAGMNPVTPHPRHQDAWVTAARTMVRSGHTHGEIAEHLRIPEAAVAALIARQSTPTRKKDTAA